MGVDGPGVGGIDRGDQREIRPNLRMGALPGGAPTPRQLRYEA
jgi:hypothetical protein